MALAVLVLASLDMHQQYFDYSKYVFTKKFCEIWYNLVNSEDKLYYALGSIKILLLLQSHSSGDGLLSGDGSLRET